MKVLHVLYQSLPQVSGSSIRSRDILMSQKEIGIDVVAITSGFQGSVDGGNVDLINGIRYIRTTNRKETVITDNKKSIFTQLKKLFAIIPFSFKLYRCVKVEKPDLLHAHAMFYCGLPAILIGRLKNIPVVYEFRSLWMFQNKDSKKSRLELSVEKFLLSLETFTLKRADAAVFLNHDLKKFFSDKRNVFKNSYVVNNGVNLSFIQQLISEAPQKAQSENLVFGYIGTLTAYEGIEFMIETFQELYDEGIRNPLLIYGNGISKDAVIAAIKKRPDIHSIQFMGSINPSEVYKAYLDIDVIVNPRLMSELTNSVTPLKPLEAMAYGKYFIGSNVGGITALIKHGHNGYVFQAENKNSLKSHVKFLLKTSVEQRQTILKNALEYVQREKSWNKNAIQYKEIYLSLLGNNNIAS